MIKNTRGTPLLVSNESYNKMDKYRQIIAAAFFEKITAHLGARNDYSDALLLDLSYEAADEIIERINYIKTLERVKKNQ